MAGGCFLYIIVCPPFASHVSRSGLVLGIAEQFDFSGFGFNTAVRVMFQTL